MREARGIRTHQRKTPLPLRMISDQRNRCLQKEVAAFDLLELSKKKKMTWICVAFSGAQPPGEILHRWRGEKKLVAKAVRGPIELADALGGRQNVVRKLERYPFHSVHLKPVAIGVLHALDLVDQFHRAVNANRHR